MRHRSIKPASAACQSDMPPTELHPQEEIRTVDNNLLTATVMYLALGHESEVPHVSPKPLYIDTQREKCFVQVRMLAKKVSALLKALKRGDKGKDL